RRSDGGRMGRAHRDRDLGGDRRRAVRGGPPADARGQPEARTDRGDRQRSSRNPQGGGEEMTMSTDPDQIRSEIDQTQREMSADVDALTEKLSPSRIVERRVRRTRTAMTNMKDRIMGSTSDAYQTAGPAASGVGDSVGARASAARDTVADEAQSAASDVTGQAQQAAGQVRDQGRGRS